MGTSLIVRQLPQLPLHNDSEAIYEVTRRNVATGDEEPATGVLGITVRYAATKGGAAIDPALELPVAERSQNPGQYWVIHDAALLDAHLTDYVGRVVYRVIEGPGDLKASTKLLVVDERDAL